MKIENFNIEQFKADFYDHFEIDLYNRDFGLKQFCKDYKFNKVTLWRTLEGKHKKVNANHYDLCDFMGKNVWKYEL